MPRYMVIERFRAGDSAAVYERVDSEGRMLPPGLRHLDSRRSADDDVCYQLMETDSPESREAARRAKQTLRTTRRLTRM